MSEQEPGPTHTPYGTSDPHGQPQNPYGQPDPYGPPPSGQPYGYGQQPAYAAQQAGDRRPGTVTAAGWITIVFSALTFVLLGLGVLVFLVARDDFVREIQTVPEFQDSGIDPQTAVGAVVAVLGFFMLWALVAVVLGVLVLRRSNVARILLVISAAVTAVLCLLSITSGGSIVPLVASVATIVLLFVGGAGDWFKRTPAYASGYQPYGSAPQAYGVQQPYGSTAGQQYPPAPQYPSSDNPYGQAHDPYRQQPPDPYGQQPPASDNPYGQQPPANPYGQQPPANPYGQQPPANPYGQQPPAEGGSDAPPKDQPGR